MFWRDQSPTTRAHDGRYSRIQSRFVLFGMILSAKHSNDGMGAVPRDRPAGTDTPGRGIE